MNEQIKPTIFVIVGVTGDLSRRKLLPALINTQKSQALSSQIKIIGTTRQTGVKPEAILKEIKDSEVILDEMEVFALDVQKSSDYQALKSRIEETEKKFGGSTQKIFYLSVPPKIVESLIEQFGQNGFGQMLDVKFLLEKPFGSDLISAQELIQKINRYFRPEQIYRIDHYLAKEMAQNIMVFREQNSLFRRTWNRDFIERIEISAIEAIGIEGRVDFYEQTGALRDLVQSHLLQLSAITLLDLPKESENGLRTRRAQVLKGLQVAKNIDGSLKVKRAQYDSYRAETAKEESLVETFVSLVLDSQDPRFEGVPIILTTGKKMDTKRTEIRIFYKRDSAMEANELVLRIQPNEGIEICIWSKIPGYQKKVEQNKLVMHYSEGVVSEAYEQVLLDAIHSDHSLFISDEEVLESWRIIEPIQKFWQSQSGDLKIYRGGSSTNEII